MNLRDLEYFVSLAKLKHFSRAAKAVHVSQPTLSMQLKKLEQELGASLLERGSKNLILSKLGTRVLPLAQEILRLHEDIKNLAKDQSIINHQELQLGIFPTLAPYLIPYLIPIIKKNYPNLKLIFHENKTAELIEHLKSGKFDLAIMAEPIHDRHLQSLTLFKEPFYLALPKNHPFSQKKSIKQSELANLELLLLEDGHCFRDQALEVCHLSKAVPRSDLTATSIETLISLVATGYGATLVPKLARNMNHPQISYIPFTKPAPERIISLFFRRSNSSENFCAKLGLRITTEIKSAL